MQPVSTHDPRQHIAPIKASLIALVSRLRDAERTVDEPEAQILFETTADVLGGLVAAYDHYERANEPAWIEREIPDHGETHAGDIG